MSAPDPSLVVIACPHCSTRYQVAYATIGAKGRTVACAQCGKSWEAHAEAPHPPRQKDFEELAEEALDEKFIEEERRAKAKREATLRAEIAAREAKTRERVEALLAAEERAAAKAAASQAAGAVVETAEASIEPPQESAEEATAPKTKAKLDHATRNRQQREFSKRQHTLHSRLPLARVRRLARLAAGIAVVLVLGGGLLFRGPIVQQFPALAGAYAAIGLGVNVIGLEFAGIRTLKSLQQGAEVLVVDGTIHSVAGHEVPVPPVIVTLLGARGEALYEWSVRPNAGELEPAETVAFETRLTAPPEDATGVRLTFAADRTTGKPADAPADPAAGATDAGAPIPAAGIMQDKQS